ncbi:MULTISPECIES: DUF1062 domain-containing protein [unclassified Fusibacter]|uniref:DUF1062 domain-containing protein n=1 Tax=unclassified Fusibacter TaxID=2624464 RepID=UPI0013E980A5|nr:MULTISPECIES: DUF1062 domain-containing protein [unclassified Fusibacter]MCK8059495.1 DUF1062 domain-containing protein [Fusibacter sp. A2]NPE21041.1 DUF1062 domain-containing protein [Fusibacter sp. A1]
MSYLNTVTWTIEPLALPTVIKTCSKCGHKATFVNTEKFRVNANKMSLDIWLIYCCEKCKSTYNLTVHERISPQEMPLTMLERFMGNDLQLAREVGFDSILHQKNKVHLDLASVPFDITGEMVNLDAPGMIELKCPFNLGQRVDKILSKKLNVSRSVIKRLHESGKLTGPKAKGLLNEKVKSDRSLRISINTMKAIG